jgi:hypothetical protein
MSKQLLEINGELYFIEEETGCMYKIILDMEAVKQDIYKQALKILAARKKTEDV